MDSRRLETPFDKVKLHLKEKKNFVLQGGAGSGKTETLKQVLKYISEDLNCQKVACITYTNKAVEEARERAGEGFEISTIHSFLNNLIKRYRVNIKQEISMLFTVPEMSLEEFEGYSEWEPKKKTKGHAAYKKRYEKYKKCFYLLNRSLSNEKALDKRSFDKIKQELEITKLNELIRKTNSDLEKHINDLNVNDLDEKCLKYNESKYDDFKKLTFGHDSLILLASVLIKKSKKLQKIIADKYAYILIDEYQDTSKELINVFLGEGFKKLKTTFCLFGDSIQAIYEGGVGDLDTYINSGAVSKIEKHDNYRCSKQVVEFLNTYKLRKDGLTQKVAFKNKEDGTLETMSDRQGGVSLYYSIYQPKKPTGHAKEEEKAKYEKYIKKCIQQIEINENATGIKKYTKLILTNKFIAQELKFGNLFQFFYDYKSSDVREVMEKDLTSLMLLDLAELADLYSKKRYNEVIRLARRSGFSLVNPEDKKNLIKLIDEKQINSKNSLELLEEAFTHKLIKKSDGYEYYMSKASTFENSLESDSSFQQLNSKSKDGAKTKKEFGNISEDEYDAFKRKERKLKFYKFLLEDRIPFSEILAYYRYLQEDSDYITMHKTKGAAIENVMVVMDDFYWNQYDFKAVYDDESEESKIFKNRKLIYVACSRAKKNLALLRVIEEKEHNKLKEFFPQAKFIKL